jgi:hypothetical protein
VGSTKHPSRTTDFQSVAAAGSADFFVGHTRTTQLDESNP